MYTSAVHLGTVQLSALYTVQPGNVDSVHLYMFVHRNINTADRQPYVAYGAVGMDHKTA